MQFNQTNNNQGDVNNVISEKGNAVQTVGAGNRVQVDRAKENLWGMLWTKIKACWKWLAG